MGTVVLIILALLVLYVAFRFLKGSRNSEYRNDGTGYLPVAGDDDAAGENSGDGAETADFSESSGPDDSTGSPDSPDSSDSSGSGGN